MACERLGRLVCPLHVEDVVDAADAKDKYSDYQMFLSTLMTVGTLLLGFALTGTLLNFTYAGDLRRDKFQTSFDEVSLAACLCATFSVIVALLISVRASVAYRTMGAVPALKAMRHSTCCMGLAEMSIYVSIYMFFHSILAYLWWAQKGPTEICSQQRGGAADCRQLHQGFEKAAGKMCAGYIGHAGVNATEPCDDECAARGRVCRQFAASPSNMSLTAFARRYKQASLTMALVLSDELCRKGLMEDLAANLCDQGTLQTESAQAACTQANANFIQAEKCSGDNVNLAVLCANVCQESWILTDVRRFVKGRGSWIFPIMMLLRLSKILQQMWAFQYFHVNEKSPGPAYAILRETLVCDDFASDTEEVHFNSESESRTVVAAEEG